MFLPQIRMDLATIEARVHSAEDAGLHSIWLMDHLAPPAAWWNCPSYAADRLAELRPLAGTARISVQRVVGLAPSSAARADVVALTERRFGVWGGVIVGTPDEVADQLRGDIAQGVE